MTETDTKGLTADMVIVDEVADGTITAEQVENMVTTMVEEGPKAMPNPKAQHGRRIIGPNKMRLLMKIQEECSALGKQGINASYCLHKFTDWKGPLKTTTKKMTGIISALKSFRK
jgi:hypothetical protein